MTSVLTRGSQREETREKPREDGGRDWGGVVTSPPEAGGGRKDPPLETLEGVPPNPHLDF